MKKVTKSEFHEAYQNDPMAIISVDTSMGYPHTANIVNKQTGDVIAKQVPSKKKCPYEYEYFIIQTQTNEPRIRNQKMDRRLPG